MQYGQFLPAIKFENSYSYPMVMELKDLFAVSGSFTIIAMPLTEILSRIQCSRPGCGNRLNVGKYEHFCTICSRISVGLYCSVACQENDKITHSRICKAVPKDFVMTKIFASVPPLSINSGTIVLEHMNQILKAIEMNFDADHFQYAAAMSEELLKFLWKCSRSISNSTFLFKIVECLGKQFTALGRLDEATQLLQYSLDLSPKVHNFQERSETEARFLAILQKLISSKEYM